MGKGGAHRQSECSDLPDLAWTDSAKARAQCAILGDGERQKTGSFPELQSQFSEKSGRTAKYNDKGKVENLVG